MNNYNATKVCARCKKEQSTENFCKDRKRKDGLFVYCNQCRYIENRLPHVRERQRLANIKHRKTKKYKTNMLLHNKKYRDSEKGKQNRKKYVKDHKEELKSYMKKYSKEWAQTPEGKESLKKARKKHYYKDLKKSRAYQREYYYRRKQRIAYRVNDAISSNIYCALREQKAGRFWESIVGYTLYDLMKHLESLFADNMSWDNYGEWHIDHIKPRHLFKRNEMKECWALSNLQPLWAKDNMSKHGKY